MHENSDWIVDGKGKLRHRGKLAGTLTRDGRGIVPAKRCPDDARKAIIGVSGRKPEQFDGAKLLGEPFTVHPALLWSLPERLRSAERFPAAA